MCRFAHALVSVCSASVLGLLFVLLFVGPFAPLGHGAAPQSGDVYQACIKLSFHQSSIFCAHRANSSKRDAHVLSAGARVDHQHGRPVLARPAARSSTFPFATAVGSRRSGRRGGLNAHATHAHRRPTGASDHRAAVGARGAQQLPARAAVMTTDGRMDRDEMEGVKWPKTCNQ